MMSSSSSIKRNAGKFNNKNGACVKQHRSNSLPHYFNRYKRKYYIDLSSFAANKIHWNEYWCSFLRTIDVIHVHECKIETGKKPAYLWTWKNWYEFQSFKKYNNEFRRVDKLCSFSTFRFTLIKTFHCESKIYELQ